LWRSIALLALSVGGCGHAAPETVLVHVDYARDAQTYARATSRLVHWAEALRDPEDAKWVARYPAEKPLLLKQQIACERAQLPAARAAAAAYRPLPAPEAELDDVRPWIDRYVRIGNTILCESAVVGEVGCGSLLYVVHVPLSSAPLVALTYWLDGVEVARFTSEHAGEVFLGTTCGSNVLTVEIVRAATWLHRASTVRASYRLSVAPGDKMELRVIERPRVPRVEFRMALSGHGQTR
jgi:hypothetical protein